MVCERHFWPYKLFPFSEVVSMRPQQLPFKKSFKKAFHSSFFVLRGFAACKVPFFPRQKKRPNDTLGGLKHSLCAEALEESVLAFRAKLLTWRAFRTAEAGWGQVWAVAYPRSLGGGCTGPGA